MKPSKNETPAASCAPHVAVLVDTSTGWGRRLVRGVSSYALKHGPWHLWVEPRGRSEKMTLPSNWKGAGVIARLSNDRMFHDLAKRDCKIVNVSSIEIEGLNVPSVTSDFRRAAEMAVEHFLSHGIKRFAYIGPMKEKYVQSHMAEFQACATAISKKFEVFDCKSESMVVKTWERRRHNMATWIESLPKPIGILAWGTNSAMQLLDVCRETRFNVPDDVSVLAGDDDELLCNTTSPTLSGIVVASEQIGHHAAAILDQLMAGEKREPEKTEINPLQINARQSTEALAIDDPDLLAVMQFIREHACHGISVQDVADKVAIGRRSLERRFKQAFQRSPLDEIQRRRLLKVQELLVKTDLQMPKIAEITGFGTPEYMATLFKSKFNTTPLKYRTQARAR